VSRRFDPLVLCYHAVSDAWPDPLAVRPSAFERQIRGLLRRGYRSVTRDGILRGGSRELYVTFDDAYKTVGAALPILERLGVPATIFACSSYADDGRPLAVPELARQAGAYPRELATMDWDELREVAERGFDVGSHTVTHPHLPELDDLRLEGELRDSRAAIEDELGRPCSFLAYPFGDEDDRVRAAARRAGYRAAFALRASRSPADPYALPRVDIYRRDNLVRAMVKTSVARGPVVALLDRSRRRTRRSRATGRD
jgi:peptidoglycan/xylan/chitin deacetylase (PgdA/CDA1 family)